MSLGCQCLLLEMVSVSKAIFLLSVEVNWKMVYHQKDNFMLFNLIYNSILVSYLNFRELESYVERHVREFLLPFPNKREKLGKLEQYVSY